MKMKKIRTILILLIITLLLTGCEENGSKVVVNQRKIDVSKLVHEHCTRTGAVENGEANLNYDIYYTGEVLNLLISQEAVKSTSSEVLNKYEEAYRNIHKFYDGLEHYETQIEKTEDTVASIIKIDYDKIDIDKLIALEGEEDNIFENKVPKVAKWKELAKKMGAKCSVVTE